MGLSNLIGNRKTKYSKSRNSLNQSYSKSRRLIERKVREEVESSVSRGSEMIKRDIIIETKKERGEVIMRKAESIIITQREEKQAEVRLQTSCSNLRICSQS